MSSTAWFFASGAVRRAFLRGVSRLTCALLAGAVAACSNGIEETKPTVFRDFAAFSKTPDDATFEALHDDIVLGDIKPGDGAEALIVDRIAAGHVPRIIVHAVLEDLAAHDYVGTMSFVRQRNLSSQFDSTPDGSNLVKETARICWLLLALRPSADDRAIDLTRTDLARADLRADGIAAGSGMNLKNVDFSGAALPGGTWRRSNLAGALFSRTSSAGRLICKDCSWGGVGGTLRLSNGKWVAP
jgi:uncharacterized protein YjbI with pentapeptide repeats